MRTHSVTPVVSDSLQPMDCSPFVLVEFSRHEYWSGLPFPTPGDIPDPGMESVSLVSPALVGRFFINCITTQNTEIALF